MKKIIIMMTLLLVSSHLIANDKGRFFTFDEIDKIVEETARKVQSNYNATINELVIEVDNLNQINENIRHSYDQEIALLNQKHDLELQALKIKYSANNNRFLWLGVGLGISSTVGTLILVDSVQLPLFTIKF